MLHYRENEFNRLIDVHKRDGFVIVSACRNDWDPRDPENNKIINGQKTNQLRRELQRSGFSYKEVLGGFIEDGYKEVNEKSFMIYNHKAYGGGGLRKFKDLHDFALRLCSYFNQEAVLVCPPGEPPHYEDRNGEITTQFTHKINTESVDEEGKPIPMPYYTQFGKGPKGRLPQAKKKFSFVENRRRMERIFREIIANCN